MFRRFVLAICIAASLFNMTSCSKTATAHISESTEENSEDKVEIELTEDKKEFLIRNSVNEEAVKNGDLKSWQIELLRRYDLCMEYLSERYPEHDFVITTYDKIAANMVKFIVIPDGDEERVFAVTLIYKGEHIGIVDTFGTVENQE